MMTRERFATIQVGSDIASVEAIVGSPYSIRSLGNGIDEYKYLERIQIGPNTTDQIEYILYVPKRRLFRSFSHASSKVLDVEFR